MNKNNLVELNIALENLSQYGNTKFKYKVLKNIEKLKPYLIPLIEVEKSIELTVEKFNIERNNLIKKLGSRGEDGKFVIKSTDKEAIDKYNKEIQTLTEVYKDDIAVYNVKLEEFKNLLSEKVEEEITFDKLPFDQFPDEGISAAQLAVLMECGIID